MICYEWEANIQGADFEDIAAGVASLQDVQIHLPRFEAEGDFSLVKPFEEMGMQEAFDQCAADFENITGVGPCIPGKFLSAISFIRPS